MNTKIHIRPSLGFQLATFDKMPGSRNEGSEDEVIRLDSGRHLYKKQVRALTRDPGPEQNECLPRKSNVEVQFAPKRVQGLTYFVRTIGKFLTSTVKNITFFFKNQTFKGKAFQLLHFEKRIFLNQEHHRLDFEGPRLVQI